MSSPLLLRAEISQNHGSLFSEIDAVTILKANFADARRVGRINVGSIGGAAVDHHDAIIHGNDPGMFVRDGVLGDNDLALGRIGADQQSRLSDRKALSGLRS